MYVYLWYCMDSFINSKMGCMYGDCDVFVNGYKWNLGFVLNCCNFWVKIEL